jgi:hypothetical protein
MKNAVIGSIIGGFFVIISVFLTNHLNTKNIDVRYNLSDSIPAAFLAKGSLSNIQQIDIVNKGERAAEKIRIKLDGMIEQYQLIKFSEIDQPEENLSDTNLEILYPELPPKGKITIVFSSKMHQLYNDNIDISHGDGVGKEAFDTKSSIFFSSVGFFLIYIILVIAFFIITGLFMRNSSLERMASRGDEELLTKKTGPVFMSADKWSRLRKETIKNFFENNRLYETNIENSKAFTVLNAEKPEYLEDYEWELLLKEGQKTLETKLSSIHYRTIYYGGTLDTFYKIEKPKYYAQNKWDEFKEDLHKWYIFQLREEILKIESFKSPIDIYKKINSKNRNSIPESYWEKYVKTLLNLYMVYLTMNLFRQYDKNYIQFLQNHDLSVLDDVDKDTIEEYAYKLQYVSTKPVFMSLEKAEEILEADRVDWIEDKDYEEMVEEANNIIALNNKQKKYYVMIELVRKIIHQHRLPKEKPNELDEDEWNEIKKMENDTVVLLEKNQEILSKNENTLNEIKEKEKRIPKLKEKIENQLRIINELLNDPTSINRIEEYDDTFAMGNLKNLKQIAALLMKTN